MPNHHLHRVRVSLTLTALVFIACKSTEEPESSGISRWAAIAFGESNVAWAIDERSPYARLQPAIDDRNVYVERGPVLENQVVVDAGKLVALDRTAGTERWRRSIVTGVNTEFSGDLVGTIWGALQVFDRMSGIQRYSYTYSPTVSLSSNLVTDGQSFYVASAHHHVLALDAATAAVRWDVVSVGGSEFGGAELALAGNALIVSTRYRAPVSTQLDSMVLLSLNKTSGAINWRISIASDLVTRPYVTDPPVVAGANVFLLTSDHRLMAFALATGEVRWQFDATYDPNAKLTVTPGLTTCDGRVIAGTGDLGLVSLNATTGAVQWKIPDIQQGSLHQLVCTYGTVMAFGSVRMFDAATGRALATYPLAPVCCTQGQFYIYGATRDENWVYFATTYGYAKVKAPL